MSCAICGVDFSYLDYEECAHCERFFCETCRFLHEDFIPFDTSPTV